MSKVEHIPFDDGYVSQMKAPSPWLSCEDIVDFGDIVVEIERCFVHPKVDFGDGKPPKKQYSIKFVGKEKKMLVNKGHRDFFKDKWGEGVKQTVPVQKLIGKRITIYGDPTVMFGRERKGGIRIRPTLPPQKEQPEQPNLDPFSFESLVASIDAASTLSEVEQIDSKARAAELTAVQLKQLSEKIEIARVTLADSEV